MLQTRTPASYAYAGVVRLCRGGRGDEPPTGLVQAMLPDSGDGATLRVMVNDKEIWVRNATSEPPTISGLSTAVDNDELYVRWQTSASDEYPIERAVRWSADDGKRWQALAIKLDEDVVVVSTRAVSSGRILVQVIVSDGFTALHLKRWQSRSRVAPDRGHPMARRWRHRTYRWIGALVGVATSSDGSIMSAEDIHWYLDGKVVGNGPEAWASLADYDGEHKAELKVRNGDQWTAASVVFLSNCSGRPAYRMQRGDC